MASAGDFARGIYTATLAADRTPISVGHRIHGIYLSNSTAGALPVIIKDASATTTYFTLNVPASGGYCAITTPFLASAGLLIDGNDQSTLTVTVLYSGV